MMTYKPVNLSMNINNKLMLNDSVEKIDEQRSLIRELIYLTHSRSNIMFAFDFLSRFMQSHNKYHFEAAKRVFKYIKRTFNYDIHNKQIKNFKIYSYTNSDWIDCTNDRENILGFMLSLDSSVIS